MVGPGIALWLRHSATSEKVPYRFPVSPGYFRDSSMCPGVDSVSENEYMVNPEGKGGRCVRLDNLPYSCADVKKSGVLTSWNPVGL
jgi:hypothetical protein